MPHTRERRARPRSAVGISAQRCRIFSEDVNNVAGRAQTAAVYSCVNTSLLCSRPDLLLCRLVCLSVCLLVRELLPDSGALRSLQFVCLHAFLSIGSDVCVVSTSTANDTAVFRHHDIQDDDTV